MEQITYNEFFLERRAEARDLVVNNDMGADAC